jgi:hypothetical protein
MVTTTDRYWHKGITDNVSDHNALMNTMKRKGRIKTVSGGYEFAGRISYAENSTYQRYSGYDALNTGASDVLTSVKYDFQQAVLHVTASGREIRMNMGDEQRMLDLVKERKKVALDTAANQFSIDLYGSGALTNQIGGLAHLIQTAGTGTVGGIDSSTYTVWRNKFKEMTGTNLAASPSVTNAASFKADMNSLWLQLVRGADKPDLIVMSHDFFALYEIGEQALQRYASADIADAGFQTLKYKGIDVIFDDNSNFSTTQERAYFLNTNHLWLVQHQDAKWSVDEVKRPTNQDAIVVPIYWMGQLVCVYRAGQGILFDAS